jgi:hypothetical protein
LQHFSAQDNGYCAIRQIFGGPKSWRELGRRLEMVQRRDQILPNGVSLWWAGLQPAADARVCQDAHTGAWNNVLTGETAFF